MPYIGQRPSKGDENNFKILDDISSYTLTFDGSDASVVSAANDTITSLNHRFAQGQRVTYNKGGGSVIAGLSDGVYYIIKHDHHTIKLATSASNATNGIAVNITGVGGGSSHTLNVAFDGINTKFKATHTNGQKAKITRSAQLVISINGVIQQPHDSATPSTGFGFDLDGTIVLSQAPVAGDVYWAHVLTNNNVTFDISDNDVDNFTGDGSTVSFNLSKTPPDNRNILVTIDGVVQYPNDPDGTVRAYNVVENVLTFTTAPDANVEIQVRHIGFAGSTSGGGGGVTNFYGRTGSVVLKNTDNIVANNAEFAGNLTVQGTMTTLDTKVTEVDQLEVGANNTTVGVAITQSGSGDILKMFSGSTLRVQSEVDGNFRIKSGTQYKGLKVLNDVGNTVGEMVGLSTINDAGAMALWNGGTKKVQLSAVGASYLTGGGFGIGTNTLFTGGAHSGTHQLTVTDNAPSMSLGVSNTDQLYIRRELANGKYTFQTNQGGGNGGVISLQPYGGSVGIGSATPAEKLDVVGNSMFRGEVAISNGNQIKLSNDSNTANTTIDCDGGARLHLKSYNQSIATFEEGVGTIFYQSSGTERLRIASNGKIGINTTDASHLFTVFAQSPSSTLARFKAFNGNSNFDIHTDGSSHGQAYVRNNLGAVKVALNSNGDSYFTGGNVGIGTVTPAVMHHLYSASGGLYTRFEATAGQVNFGNSNGAGIVHVTSTSQPLRFLVNDNNERARIASDGKFGIGDFSSGSAPSQALHVKGSAPAIFLEHTGGYDMTLTTSDGMGMNGITVNGGFLSLAYNNKNVVMCRTGGAVGINTTNPENHLLELYTAASADWKFRIHTNVSDGAGFYQRANGDFEMVLRDASNNNNFISGNGGGLEFATSGTEKLRITSAGFVQIGAPADAAEAPLHVTAENSQGINAIFGAKDFVVHNNYNYDDANIALQGRDAGDNDTGAGIQFTVRNTANTNWLHGAITMDVSGNYIFKNGGAGTTVGTERLRITANGQTKLNIASNGALTEPLVIRNGGTGGGTNVGMVFYNGDESSTGAGALAKIKAIDVGNYDSDLVFETGLKVGWSNGGTTERLRIDSQGNVKSGTVSSALNFTDSNSGLTKFIEIGATGGGDALLTTHSSGYGIGYFGYEAGGDRLVIACDNGGGNNTIDFIPNAGTATGGGTDNLGGKAPNMRLIPDGSLYAGGTIVLESDLNWTHDTYQRPHIFSGVTGGNPSDGVVVVASPETNPSNTRVGAIVFGCKTSSTSGVSNSGLKAVMDCYTNSNVSDAWKTGARINFSVRRDNGELENKFQITRDGIIVRRQDSGNEGGEVMLCRPSDDTPHFHIDAFGAAGTPGNTNDWVNNANPTMRIHTGGVEIFKIGTNGNIKLPHNPVFCGVYQNGSSVNVGSNVTVIFDDTVYINKGAGQNGSGAPYDTSTGEFTCPSGGYYQVYVQAHLQAQTGGAYSSWRIQKNGVTQSNAWKADGSGGSLVASVILNCAGDDIIRARFVSNETTQYTDETYWVLYILKVG